MRPPKLHGGNNVSTIDSDFYDVLFLCNWIRSDARHQAVLGEFVSLIVPLCDGTFIRICANPADARS
jgi:hypothetical protein